jgi:hypothetical protein
MLGERLCYSLIYLRVQFDLGPVSVFVNAYDDLHNNSGGSRVPLCHTGVARLADQLACQLVDIPVQAVVFRYKAVSHPAVHTRGYRGDVHSGKSYLCGQLLRSLYVRLGGGMSALHTDSYAVLVAVRQLLGAMASVCDNVSQQQQHVQYSSRIVSTQFTLHPFIYRRPCTMCTLSTDTCCERKSTVVTQTW